MKIVGGIHRKQLGFTIVELLIVIVVIAILAALAIVAFNSVQARANNSKTESAVAQWRKILISYATENGNYPLENTLSGTSFCLGEATNYPTGCWNGNVVAAFNNEVRSYIGGTLPNPSNQPLYMYTSNRIGAAYSRSDINLDGQPHTWSISYVLKGDVRCSASGQAGGIWTSASSTPNANGRIEFPNGNTLCRVLLPDPSKL